MLLVLLLLSTVLKGSDTRCLVLVRATAQQAAALEAQDKAARIKAIREAAGFAAVFDLLRASNKPCVGHNCMMDIRCGCRHRAGSRVTPDRRHPNTAQPSCGGTLWGR